MQLERTEACARKLDEEDPLADFRGEFHVPSLYFRGNSLGLAPRSARTLVGEELEAWERFGVEGHFHGEHPWMPYQCLLRGLDLLLVAPVPLYSRFLDVYRFVQILEEVL